MRVRLLAVVATFSLLLSNVYGDSAAALAAQQVRTYQYRPDVFADRPLGVGLPSNPSILQGYLWYVRLEAAARALLGMEPLAHFLQDNRVPGIDFTNDATLTTSDIERLFQTNLWMPTAAAGVYKFRFLKLAGTLVGDEALPTIGRQFDLEVLGLGAKVSDRGLPWLKNLVHLKVLEVSSPLVTDRSAGALSQLGQLERLSLKETAVTDQGLMALSKLPLKHLELGRAVTDQGLTTVSKVLSLRQLDLSRSHVSRIGLATLTSLPGLHTLFLGPSITDADMGALTALKNLKRLDLTGAKISDASADILAAMPQLEELALSQTGVGNATLEKLSRLPHLRYLEVSGTRITPEAFGSLHGYSALQVFSFSTSRRLIRRDLEPLARFPILHSILVNGTLLGPELIGVLRARVHSWLPILVPEVEAASSDDAKVEQALEIASAPAEKQLPRRFEGVSGLERIHQAESSLEDISGDPSGPKIQVFEENEKNFLGEITIGVVSSRDKNKKGR